MSLALKARQKAKRKGGGSKERVFGCDLVEHLQQSGKEVPQVLQSCAEFVEQHGVVDGIYRLSGVSSNIQRLRHEFDVERSPELRRAVYLQDIHCVSSLCKAYFRELPNPLLTFRLYDRFADAVATQMEEVRLVKIKEVLKELPPPHYRTLEFLMRHLLRMASYSHTTNMHARNLAIVWAPNLLRSRDIEASGFNGTAAFMEVRVQSIVVEFILTHVEQLFGDAPLCGGEAARRSRLFPGDGSGPYNVPAALSQGDGPPPIRPYHTIIEFSEHRRKGSLKAKKWKSIFHLGRSDAKRKLGKAEEKEEKCGKLSLRPAKSMDSLSSVPYSAEGEPRLSTACAMKQPPQRRESFDACSSLPPTGTFPALEESPEEKLTAAEEPRGPESESESSTKSEPTTPRPGRVAAVGTRSRAEKCAGVHISGPFSVTVPLHITSNLSRLTRGQQCPALAQHGAVGSPVPVKEHKPARNNAEEDARLSMELRDSFAFLDCQDVWLEHGDGDTAARAAMGREGCGDGEGYPAMDEGMESGFMNPGESPVGQPPSYLSIEECMDEEMFYLAPSGSDEPTGDTDSDDMFLSAHDELSLLAADPETPTSGERGAELWGGSSPPVEEDPGDGGNSEDPGGGTEEVGGQSLVNEERSGGIGWSGTESGGEVEKGGAEERCGVGDPKTSLEWSPQEPTEATIPRGALGDVPKVPPIPMAAQGDPPTTVAVPEVLPTPSADQGVLPTPMEVQEVPPTPTAAQEDPPTPTAAQGVTPTPMASKGVPPTPMEVQEDCPTPMAVQGVPSTPIAAPKVTPTPMAIPEVPPTPTATQDDPPTPMPVQDVPPTPIAAPKVTPTPMPVQDVPPNPTATQDDPPTPMPVQGVPPTPTAAAMGFSPPPEAVTPTPTLGTTREPSPPPPGPCHPHPRAVLRRDGSAPVLLASRSVRVQQARSVPVVPPKPQFATVPPPPLRPQPPRAEGQGANWHHERPPMRRIHTYGGEELPSPPPPRRPPPQPLPPHPPTSALPQSPNEAAAAAAP